jgi:hypothetical protein
MIPIPPRGGVCREYPNVAHGKRPRRQLRRESHADQIRGLLPDQHRGRVGVPADRAGHDLGVGHPKSVDTADP